jgi:hypothetical protein
MSLHPSGSSKDIKVPQDFLDTDPKSIPVEGVRAIERRTTPV